MYVKQFLTIAFYEYSLHGYILWLREYALCGVCGKFMALGAALNQWHMETR